MRADFDWPRPDRRREFLRARMNAAGRGGPVSPTRALAALTSCVWANGLVDNPAGAGVIARGESVRFLPYGDLLHFGRVQGRYGHDDAR
jgi:molybdopterin molybdotransferase